MRSGQNPVLTNPSWWDEAPRELIDHPLPGNADVVIVGSGYTGLSAALILLRAGRTVVIVEQGLVGEGASSRSGGMMGSGHKLGFTALKRRFGHDVSLRILREGLESLQFAYDLINSEKIDCHLDRCGRFRGAWTEADFAAMGPDLEFNAKHTGLSASLVEKSDVHQEVVTDLYHGGCIFHDHAAVHPALLHSGLLKSVLAEGGVISCNNPALGIDTDDNQKVVTTANGKIKAPEIIIATNGYRAALNSTWRRSTVPVASFVVATEPLGDGVAESLIPGRRMIVETRKRFGYYRLSPDRQRIIFGGRASLSKMDVVESAKRLQSMMVTLFPQLKSAAVTHSWTGFVAMTRDGVPHVAKLDKGVTVVGGYNGSGIAMAPYLGAKAAHQLLGNPEGETIFADIPLQAVPLYTGNPWFLGPMEKWYRHLDRKEGS